MKIAVISDVHGNIFALESVLKDIEARNIDTLISTGDLVGYLPYPNEVVNSMRDHKILVVKGNHDKRISEMEALSDAEFEALSPEEIQKSASSVYVAKELTSENITYLRNLPDQVQLAVSGKKIMFVHGSPRSVAEYMYEDSDVLEEIMVETDADVIVSGHTHLPYHKRSGEIHFLNAGSIGKPKHGNANAKYLILSIEEGKIESEFIEVTYDVEAIVKEVRRNPYIADGLAEALLQGK